MVIPYLKNLGVVLLRKACAGSIFVPEVDWCSTNINHQIQWKNQFQISGKPKDDPISINFFYFKINILRKI